ncbi:MAG: hypothetical protein ABJC89_05265 [Acidobacteriota bacterium]
MTGRSMAGLALLTAALCAGPVCLRANRDVGDQMNAVEIFDRVQHANQSRENALRSYQSTRRYAVFEPGREPDAELVVSMQFVAPSTKTYQTITSKGLGWIDRRVFHGLLEAERQAAAGKDKADSAITSKNYDVQLLGTDQRDGRPCYVIALIPKRQDKYLFRGKAWIDREDFGIARLEGEPVKSPSFWIVKSPFVREYRRVDRFWLPNIDETHSQIRFAGEYILRIQYADYQVTAKD